MMMDSEEEEEQTALVCDNGKFERPRETLYDKKNDIDISKWLLQEVFYLVVESSIIMSSARPKSNTFICVLLLQRILTHLNCYFSLEIFDMIRQIM